ncbi:PstS family phosphate ABC transporter substrate-binding protein [Limnoraphis robusta Tam1]|uniref:PstS family phosphate ABC transporter substrate-binding protein n=1 Tax=Limnoraphis robusta TaxID=1118279 RepID=UPI002B2063CD|nr:PstS family phosphate ABC transporter substrate-binding protein [Limnoraphis robusta]MEA5497448.1 PstS family phosphate ABC transporter substrate-binding protein [Limnoraphis robusta BA-68 BA1]MEA5540549.1 PstS family phosphate ABC transporter substrate-binding protein [Limnoraphis robusta Tam1]
MQIKGMQFKQNRWTVAGAFTAIAATVALAIPAVHSQGTPTVKIDGSSTVYPITEAVAEEFQKAKQGAMRVTVGISGTGGGFKKFCAGQTDISNASRPIKSSEADACKSAGITYIELPVAYDALTVVVHPSNPITNITPAELKKMWEPAAQGKIMKWNQVNSSWPDKALKLYGPGADSGTFDYFTEEINGKAQASRTDYTPSEDDNVLVQGVSRDPNALGYFGFAYYENNKSKIKALSVNGVQPSLANVNNGTYKPLSRPIFIYVNSKSLGRPEVKAFVEYYLQNGGKLSKEVGYVPLPSQMQQQAVSRFQNRTLGSAAQ